MEQKQLAQAVTIVFGFLSILVRGCDSDGASIEEGVGIRRSLLQENEMSLLIQELYLITPMRYVILQL